MFRRAAILTTLACTLAACSGTFFGPRESGSGPLLASGPTTAELLEIDIGTLPTDSAGVERLRALSVATQSAREERRAVLRGHRGELVADLLTAARAYRDVRPELAEWYAAAAGLLVDVDAADARFPDAAVERVRIDLSAAGRADVSDVVAEVRAALGEADPPRGPSPRATVLRLADLSDGLGPWSRYGDWCDGGAFSREAVAASPVAVGPESLADGALASDENIHTAQALLGVVSACADVRRLDDGIAAAVAAMVDDVEARLTVAAVPIDVPTAFIADDPRLVPPTAFTPIDPTAPRGLGFTFRRLVIVRTDGVYAMVAPHVALDEQRSLTCPAVVAGWGFPGRQLVAFDRLGAIPPDALVDERVPALTESLEAMEGWLSGERWLPPEETRRDGSEVGVSLVADGDTYFSTLRPVLRALSESAYSPVALHTWRPDSQTLDAVAVRLVDGVGTEDNVLVVRADGYVLQPYDPENLLAPITVSRADLAPNLSLHRALVGGIADGTIDPNRALTIRVDDNAVDYGILAHLVAAIGFEREVDDLTSDRELLRAPILRDDGVPRVLNPAGLRLAI